MIDYVRRVFENVRIDEYNRQKPYQHVHLKRDGYCILAVKDGKGEMHCYTRTPRRVWSMQDWFLDLQQKLKPGELVLGELFVDGGTSHDVASVICKEPTKKGIFEAFYSPNVHSFEEFYASLGERDIPTIKMTAKSDKIPPGYEGFVLKQSYHPNTPFGWMKWKPVQTIDLRVTGFEFSTEGRHFRNRSIKNVLAQTDDGGIKVRIGTMDDGVREHMTLYRDFWIGKIIEVRYQFVTSKGSLRHPRYVRMRDDKSTTN